MTAPLTPPDCDLRDFPTMPLDGARLFGSEFHGVSSDAAWRAGVTLWLRSWHQVPAASLPDDDVQLARLAEFARDVKAWRKVREQALRGWIKCDDGRLYHPVVADKANDAWERRAGFQEKVANKADRQRRWRDRIRDISQQLRDVGVTPPMNASLASLERLLRDAVGAGETSTARPERQLVLGEGEGSIPLDKSNGAAVDSDKRFWDDAKVYLGKGKASLIGQWVRVHGKDATAKAITAAQLDRAVDPVPWIQGHFRKRKVDDARGERTGVGVVELSSPC